MDEILSGKNLGTRVSIPDGHQDMPKLLGKMSAARMNALEDEVERLRKRVASLEDRLSNKS